MPGWRLILPPALPERVGSSSRSSNVTITDETDGRLVGTLGTPSGRVRSHRADRAVMVGCLLTLAVTVPDESCPKRSELVTAR